MANILAHEYIESITDLDLQAWYDDTTGEEISDKCQNIFPNHPVVSLGEGKSSWVLQPHWSNYAYYKSTGLPSSNGDLGCVYGLLENTVDAPLCDVPIESVYDPQQAGPPPQSNDTTVVVEKKSYVLMIVLMMILFFLIKF